MTTKGISIRNVTKNWGDVYALRSVSLEIEPGSFTTLLGPSGCGKTTLLRSLAGLEEPNSGELWIGDRMVFGNEGAVFVPPKKRNLGLVFQSYALWPHMTVWENIAFGLKLQKHSATEINRIVEENLAIVGLTGYGRRYPSEMSGGQQQRVSLARMLAVNPEVLLMDEPLSNLDAKLRVSLRAELKRIHKATGLTVVYVTHDQIEAMSLSTHIAVMRDGKILDYGEPDRVYQNPASVFVADFMGNPQINLVPSVVSEEKGKLVARSKDGSWRVPVDSFNVKAGDNVVVGFRPEDTVVTVSDSSLLKIDTVQKTGPDLLLTVLVDGEVVIARTDKKSGFEMDQNVELTILPGSINLFDPESEEAIPSKGGSAGTSEGTA
jgi:multiple sugar transport system ATP-binding protein